MKIVSYNILNPFHAVAWNIAEGFEKKNPEEIAELKAMDNSLIEKEGRVDNWSTRKDFVIENLKNSDFSLACLQEVCAANTLKDLSKMFTIIELSQHNPLTFEDPLKKMGNTLIFNSEKVDYLGHKIFQNSKNRGQIYADFRDLATGQVFRVASVHLKGYDTTKYDPDNKDETNKWLEKQEGKKEGYSELCEVIQEVEKNIENIDHIVIAGDFNEDPNEMEYPNSRQVKLLTSGYTFDGNLTGTENGTERKIDWIFHKNLKQIAIKLSPLTLEQNLAASDHRLTGTEFQF